MSKNMVFTHTDLDGIGCAILAYLAFGRENVDVEYCDYKDVDGTIREFYLCGNPEDYDAIYITDISVDEEVASEIDSLVTAGQKWRLLDHHATALWLNKYEWCEVQVCAPEDSYFKTSGTELFAMYLFDNEQFDHYDAHTIENINRFVDIVRDYDTWRWKELGDEGIVCKHVNDLFYIYGREKFIEWVMDQLTKSEPELKTLHGEIFAILDPNNTDQLREPYITFPRFTDMDNVLLEQKQKDIDRYIEKKDKQIITVKDQFGYSCGVVFAEQYFSELGNRLCELHPDLDYVAMIDICKGVVSYRTVSDDLDLGGEIAHSFGGGGHKKAAGSTFDGRFMMEMVMYGVFQNKCNLIAVEIDSGD